MIEELLEAMLNYSRLKKKLNKKQYKHSVYDSEYYDVELEKSVQEALQKTETLFNNYIRDKLRDFI